MEFWLVSGLEPDFLSAADARGRSGRSFPAAHLGTHPPRDSVPCFPLEPGGGSQWAVTPAATPPPHLLRAPLRPSPAYLFHLAEDPQQVSSKDTPELFLTPATPQQLFYEYWVCGHVLQTLWEPVWPPASHPAISPQICPLVLSQNQCPMCARSTEPLPWSNMGNGDLERVNDSSLLFILQKGPKAP